MRVGNFRRSNLFDYEVLRHDDDELHHYMHEVDSEKVKWEAINWKGFGTALQGKHHSLKYSVVLSPRHRWE